MTTAAVAVASTGKLLATTAAMTTTTTPCSFTRAPPAGRHALGRAHPGPRTTARLTAASGNPGAGRCPTCAQADSRGHRRRASTLGMWERRCGRRRFAGHRQVRLVPCCPLPPAPPPPLLFSSAGEPYHSMHGHWSRPSREARRLLTISCLYKESVNQENPRTPCEHCPCRDPAAELGTPTPANHQLTGFLQRLGPGKPVGEDRPYPPPPDQRPLTKWQATRGAARRGSRHAVGCPRSTPPRRPPPSPARGGGARVSPQWRCQTRSRPRRRGGWTPGAARAARARPPPRGAP